MALKFSSVHCWARLCTCSARAKIRAERTGATACGMRARGHAAQERGLCPPSQLPQQRLGGHEIARLKAFAEEAVDIAEQPACVIRFALVAPKSGEAHGGPQLQRSLRAAMGKIERSAQ